MDMSFLSGAREDFVANGYFHRGVQQARTRGAQVRSQLIPDSGHFFLLEKRQETLKVLKGWVK
jgi:hypothetical protein